MVITNNLLCIFYSSVLTIYMMAISLITGNYELLQAASAIGAVSLEDMTENDIIEPVIQELSREVARETMQYYGNKFRKKETNAVSHTGVEF